LKNSIVELYDEEKRRKIFSDDLNSHNFVSKNGISHFSKHISLVFQQAGTFFGTNKRYDFDFWFLITIRKLRSIEPIIVIWSVLLMGVVRRMKTAC